MTEAPDPAVVTALAPDGTAVPVHDYYEDGDYVLADVPEVFGLGRMEADQDNNPVLVLRDNEIRQLKSLAYTHSFDCEEGLIALCLNLHRVGSALNRPEVHFRSNI